MAPRLANGYGRNPQSEYLSEGRASPGTMTPTMDIRELQDEELVAQAREWRQRALRGERDARGMAHELECEVRRRFGAPRNDMPRQLREVRLLSDLPQARMRRWMRW
jgi:hypothetical protein